MPPRSSRCRTTPTTWASVPSCAPPTTGSVRSATTCAPTASAYKDFVYFPCMSYAHKYANSVSQLGAMETIQRFAAGGMMSTLIRRGVGSLTRDIQPLMRLLVDAEMKRFEALNTPVIFVQNVVTDPLLGLKLYPVFTEFDRYLKERYGAEAGYITMNLPLLLDALAQAGGENPIVCASINKIGFRMSGGVDAYRDVLRTRKCRAMGVVRDGPEISGRCYRRRGRGGSGGGGGGGGVTEP